MSARTSRTALGIPTASLDLSVADEKSAHCNPALALLDEVVYRLLHPTRREPTDAVAVTGQATATGPWRSYRAGRAKVATQAAVYLTWLAPPAEAVLAAAVSTLSGRRGFHWSLPGYDLDFVDLLAPAGSGAEETRSTAVELLGSTDPLAGVRILAVSAPMRSSLLTEPGSTVGLVGTRLWFEADP